MTVIARGCHDCNPQTDSRRGRRGPQHFSVDINEVRTHNGKPLLDCMVIVTHHGEPTCNVAEVMTGPGGFARRYPLPARRCDCGSGLPLVEIDEDDGYEVLLP